MESSLIETAQWLAALIDLPQIWAATRRAIVLIGSVFLGIYLVERYKGHDNSVYRSRHFLNDMAYFLFYQGGLYMALIGTALANALQPRLEFLKIDALAALPAPVHWILYTVTIDFLDYWFHRVKHAVPFLWAFHAVHHAQERMTFVTSWRFHPIEQVIANLVTMIPLLVLGVPTSSWLPIIVALYIFEALQHSQLPWTYGPFYKVLVSPVFHAIHHGTDRKHYDTNFAKTFSAWDFMFGTAIANEPRPASFGISGEPIPETLSAQFAAPFQIIRRQLTPLKPQPEVPAIDPDGRPRSA